MQDIAKEFKPSSWAINNRTSIYIITIIITLAGLLVYNGLPKEQFPEITIPTIYVTTQYPGTSPENMEKLVTKEIEKQCKSLKGLKRITSNSFQDFSMVKVEFNTDVDIVAAKQEVKDAVDKARATTTFPKDLPQAPDVLDVNLSDLPILYVNISGDYDLKKLKDYADDIQDRIEAIPEINRVDIAGALDREVQIDLDMNKMAAAKISFQNIKDAVSAENITTSGGTVKMNGERRDVTLKQEFSNAAQIGNLIIRSPAGGQVYLKDIAAVKDTFKEQESYARLGAKPVITLNIVKRSGTNLIEASDHVRQVVQDMQNTVLPKNLNIVITGDQSDLTRTTLHDLINTIIIGFVLVTLILMFFMGVTNAIFVGLSVPLSMFIAFMVMPSFGFTMNMIVLFSFLLALGIVVDDAIVVIENTHRIFDNGKMPIMQAAKTATGEVFLPVLAGTLTTLAPFVPLLFWKGIVGKFMFFLPLTLIITLLASLVVAYIINPVFAVDFMKPHEHGGPKKSKWTKGMKITCVVLLALALIFYVFGSFGMGNFTVFLLLLYLLNKFVLEKLVEKFQTRVWPGVQRRYVNLLKRVLKSPGWMMTGMLVLFVLSFIFFAVRGPKVEFFPESDPNFVYVYLKMPIGTDQAHTNEVLEEVEGRVNKVLGIDYAKGKENPVVTSVISNVTIAAADPMSDDNFGPHYNLGKITVSFVQYNQRHGVSTQKYLDQIREAVKGIPGAEIAADKEQGGPPVGKPIVVEITGDNLDTLIATSQKLQQFIKRQNIGGIEELRSDFDNNKPELVFDLNREFANRQGISTGQIGFALRSAIFGTEISRFRDPNEDDDFPINMRVREDQRYNVDLIRNMVITYQDMNMNGAIRQVPISSLADIHYSSTYGGIKRKDQKRIISLTSNVLGGYNANEVVKNIQDAIAQYHFPAGISATMGGDQQDQQETMSFLQAAMLVAIGLIFLILVTLFNSLSKPLIIISEVVFSIIGVLIGVALFKMSISIVMSGVGLIALAGIVVRNGILLVEFTDLMLAQGMPLKEALLEAGKTRMTPVILTATATILGLIPLAVGMNIDFVALFSELNPHLFFGGDNADFWGPLCWTMIFGLIFATFLTLVLVPVMYLMMVRLTPMRDFFGGKWVVYTLLLPPVFLLLYVAYRIWGREYRRQHYVVLE
ncbi:efflux RND transporter permease subunit [Compostibacter hankyongensis]|uniref:Efflux RND transporter permease subunit n=1 Tax=Compostibacter hankyongensis TaxID=1007089 RepID=A0ABP8FG28_9BACT